MSLPRAASITSTFRRKAGNRGRSAGSVIAGLAAAMCLGACIFGGTGTDTENNVAETNHTVTLTGVSARVTDSTGAPMAGISLRIFDPLYRPDSARAPYAWVRNTAESLVSDTGGYVRLYLAAKGKYVVEGLAAGMTLFFDTLAVADTQSASIYTFRARTVKAFSGKINLASGMRIDSGRVFVRGTGHSAQVDTAGNYDLGLLPSDVGRMAVGVRFASRPVSVRQAMPSGDGAKPVYTCRDVPVDSAAKLSTPASPISTTIQDSIRLDTGTVNPALQSCDSLVKGSVISVVSPTPRFNDTVKADTVSDPLLVLSGQEKAITMLGTRTIEPVVVSLSQCVPEAGSEHTTYDLQMQSTSVSNDILVRDVAEKCLVK